MAGLTLSPGEKDPRRVADVVRQASEGKSNATGAFTLTANATSTTVPAPTCSPSSVILLSAQTAHAANDMATTSTVSAYRQFVVSHASNSRNDRTFGYAVLG